jgi:hypothetical protein
MSINNDAPISWRGVLLAKQMIIKIIKKFSTSWNTDINFWNSNPLSRFPFWLR